MPNPPISLKALEAFMGHSIKETTVPFDIDRPLTEAELAETVKYCRHDVEETVEVWVRNIAEFNTTMFFVNHFHLGSNSIGKTKAQLAAEILGGNGKGKSFDDEFDFPILDCLRLKKYRFVADWYKNPVNHDYGKAQENITVAGVPHTFAWGGGHGAIPKYHAHGIFLVIDVTAYYPSLQKQFKIGYRVMDHPENFEFIHDSNNTTGTVYILNMIFLCIGSHLAETRSLAGKHIDIIHLEIYLCFMSNSQQVKNCISRTTHCYIQRHGIQESLTGSNATRKHTFVSFFII